MNGDFFNREKMLERYALVGGPPEMVPLLERVAEVCAANPAVADLAKQQSAEIFEGLPVPTTDSLKKWTDLRPLSEGVGVRLVAFQSDLA